VTTTSHAHPPIPLTTPTVPATPALPDLPKDATLDTLLTRTTDKADPGFVHYGTLRVESGVADDFEKAQRYLAKDPDAVKMLGALVNDTKPHTLKGIDKNDLEGDRFEPKGSFGRPPVPDGGTIYWDPKSALRTTGGTSQSPALGLLHEEGHARQWSAAPQALIDAAGMKNKRYDNAEEQRNETTVERNAATILGEGQRGDHGGMSYTVADPTSRVSTDPEIARTPGELQAAVKNEIRALRSQGYNAPPPPAVASAITPWDHKEHTGSFVAVDQNTVVQHVGKGTYQMYDVNRDLHGTFPDQTRALTIDAHGRQPAPQALSHELGHTQ
jgi:hypothetical protein